MDLAQPVSYINYEINKILSDVCETIAENSMSAAVTEEHYKNSKWQIDCVWIVGDSDREQKDCREKSFNT